MNDNDQFQADGKEVGQALMQTLCAAEFPPHLTWVDWLTFTASLIVAAASTFYLCAYLYAVITWLFPHLRGAAAPLSTSQSKEQQTL